MPLYIFECSDCQHLIKKSMESPPDRKTALPCPKCERERKFKFLREADYQEDWFSSMLKIHNKRRRPGDRLHRTEPRPEKK